MAAGRRGGRAPAFGGLAAWGNHESCNYCSDRYRDGVDGRPAADDSSGEVD